MSDSAASPGPVPAPSAVRENATSLGWEFVAAVVAGDFDRLQALLAPGVRFRALVPKACRDASTAAGARAIVEDWFGGTDTRALLGSTIGLVGDRLVLGYRLELTEDGERRIVEQHVAATVDGGSFHDLAVLCTGFRPLAADPGGVSGTPGAAAPGKGGHRQAPASTPAARLDATGLSCATLTPTISAALRGLEVGAVLEIVADDPEAEAGLRSWTRLTGNELLAAEAGPGPARRYQVRRAPRDAVSSTFKGVG